MKLAATILLCSAAAAQADLVIQSRTCELRSSREAFPSTSYTDFESVNQIGLSGPRTVDLTTIHGEHLWSTVTPTEISAYLTGGSSHSNPGFSPFTASHSMTLMVVFAITGSPSALSMRCSGGATPASARPENEVVLTIRNLNTGQLVFDFPWNPHTTSGFNLPATSNVFDYRWNQVLAPGTYLLTAEARPGATDARLWDTGVYGHWTDSPPPRNVHTMPGSIGSCTLGFTLTTGPATAPAMALIPSPSAALSLSVCVALRRRRR